jgi:DNA-directed RNA polymerase subunit RPC12/RpoP
MGFDDYFIQEEFLFPEEGGVTGGVMIACPHCGAEWELQLKPGNTSDRYACANCGEEFSVNWTSGKVSG